jgi:putative nucleotidyltransferase with HDIG domain
MDELVLQDPSVIIKEFVAAVNIAKLYAKGHPQIDIFTDHLFSSVIKALMSTSELTYLVIEDDIIFNSRPLLNLGNTGVVFVDSLRKKGVERLTLMHGVTKLEIAGLIDELINAEKTDVLSTQGIKIGRINFAQENNVKELMLDSNLGLEGVIKKTNAEVKHMYQSFVTKTGFDQGNPSKLASEFVKSFSSANNSLKYLSTIKSEDEYTFVHTTNVALLSMKLAEYLGFTGQTVIDITMAALMHDIGKLLIPDSILNKPGLLTDAERLIMQSHALRGAQYISKYKESSNLAMLVALEHHIKFDGSGYPVLSEDWRPNIISQIISVCDIYDALRSRRPYREPMEPDEIIRVLKKESGSALNPSVVDNFINMINEKWADESQSQK